MNRPELPPEVAEGLLSSRPAVSAELRSQLARQAASKIRTSPDQAQATLALLADTFKRQLTMLGFRVDSEQDSTGLTLRIEPPKEKP